MNFDITEQNVYFREFFETIAPWCPAYRHQRLTFVGVVHEGFDVILRGRLNLSWQPPASQKRPFRTASLRAGDYHLGNATEGLARQLSTAGLMQGFVLEDGVLRFLPDAHANVSAHVERRDRWTVLPDPYVAQLTLAGVDTRTLLSSSARRRFERELLEAERPFKSLEEWATAYGFKLSTSDSGLLEVFAERIAWLASGSSVRGGKAEIIVCLAPGLDPSHLRVKASNADPTGGEIEEIASGSILQWSREREDGTGRAVWAFDLPQEAVIHCATIYGACLQHERVFADPRALPNRARMMIEVADPGLERLSQLLTNPSAKDQKDDFEAAVPMLLHMLGFSNAYVSALSNMKGEADVFTQSPAGDVLVVECTTDVPDVVKIDKLLTRVFAMRKALCTPLSQLSPGRVTPVMVIPRTRDNLGPAAKKHANDHSVVMLCREDIEEAIERTRFAPNADAVLQAWRREPLNRFLLGES